MNMTDEQIVRTLAEREGWRWNERHSMFDRYLDRGGWTTGEHRKSLDYLHSRDALAPVLAKMTPEEWDDLFLRLLGKHRCASAMWTFRNALTLPPPTLARLMAEAIAECASAAKPST